jgi:hypothetical protein
MVIEHFVRGAVIRPLRYPLAVLEVVAYAFRGRACCLLFVLRAEVIGRCRLSVECLDLLDASASVVVPVRAGIAVLRNLEKPRIYAEERRLAQNRLCYCHFEEQSDEKSLHH